MTDVRLGNHPVPSWIQRGKLRWVWGLWEPLMFYRRSAYASATSPGNSEWTESWYERMHSREMVETLAELGVNVLSTHYYKGFGLRAEAAEMERAARFTELCHEYGIRVLGYHQWATICYETFLDEIPHAENWIQRDADGRLLLYGRGTYWRWLGCQQHADYVDYLERVVRQCLTEARMDGIEWDGTVYNCHCDLCQAAFRDYLEQTHSAREITDLLGLPHVKHVRIPTTQSERDPLYQQWLEFRRIFMHQRLRQYNDLIKSINPEAAQVTYDMYAAPAAPPDAIDILVDENHDFPYVHEGQLTSKSRGLKHAFAQDRMVLSTAWLRAPSSRKPDDLPNGDTEAQIAAFGIPTGGLRLPENAAEVKRDMAETAMYGGHLITPTWATRAVGGSEPAFMQPELREAVRQYFDFFRRHEDLYAVDASLATVAIYRSRPSLSHDFFNSYPCVMGMEQVCLQQQIPYQMLFSYQVLPSVLARFAAIVLAEQTCLSAADVAALHSYVEQGGGLLLTGRSGTCDEYGRCRQRHPFRALFGHPRVVFLPDNPERLSRPERDHPPAYHDMRLPPRSAEIAQAILTACGGALPYRVIASPFVGTDVYRLRSGTRVIHLLNYDNQTPVDNVKVRLSEPWQCAEARVITPDVDTPDKEVIHAGKTGCAVCIGRLETYALLVLPPDGAG